MFTRKLDASAVLLAFVLGAGVALAEGPNLGKPIEPPTSRRGTSAFNRTVQACRRKRHAR